MNVPHLKRQAVSSTQNPFTTYLVLSLVFHAVIIAGMASSTLWLHQPRRYQPASHTVSLVDAPATLQQVSQVAQGRTADKKPASGGQQPPPQPTPSDLRAQTAKQPQAASKRNVVETKSAQTPKIKQPSRSIPSHSARTAKTKAPPKAKPTTPAVKPQHTIKPSASTAKTRTERRKRAKPSPPSPTPTARTQTDQARQQAAEQRLAALRSRYGKHGESPTGTETTESLQHVRLRAYQELVREQIVDAWVLPLLQDTARHLQATALLTVDREGHITQLKILETSNNPLFDESLLRAIRQAAPLPVLPADYHGTYLELELHFNPGEA